MFEIFTRVNTADTLHDPDLFYETRTYPFASIDEAIIAWCNNKEVRILDFPGPHYTILEQSEDRCLLCSKGSYPVTVEIRKQENKEE